jgi:hypothetical protein
LRTQAASIGDEFAATQAELERSRADLEAAVQAGRQEAQAVRDAARAEVQAAQDSVRFAAADSSIAAAPRNGNGAGSTSGADSAAAPEMPVSNFDAALASAFGDAASASPPPDVESAADVAATAVKPVEYRTVDAENTTRKRRPRGPIVDLEVSLARGIAPADVDADAGSASGAEHDADGENGSEPSAAPERSPETQAWRRTAMAELTALAGDSDDLTPRRRR